jgi:hypothetical protein
MSPVLANVPVSGSYSSAWRTRRTDPAFGTRLLVINTVPFSSAVAVSAPGPVMSPVRENVRVEGLYNSALAPIPSTIKTRPSESSAARYGSDVVIAPVRVNNPVAGS